jgi:hypothetical protein
MRTLHLIRPRRTPSRRRLVNTILGHAFEPQTRACHARSRGRPGNRKIGERHFETAMNTADVHSALARLFSELVDGANSRAGGFVLNTGDLGLLRSLDKLSAADASRAVNDGATIAAHAQHVRYGLSLMNRWATAGGNPFADATWDEAWKMSVVDAHAWQEIRDGLRNEAHRWLEALNAARDVTEIELTGMIASIAHLAYHLGAIRQIDKQTRGPTEGTF